MLCRHLVILKLFCVVTEISYSWDNSLSFYNPVLFSVETSTLPCGRCYKVSRKCVPGGRHLREHVKKRILYCLWRRAMCKLGFEWKPPAFQSDYSRCLASLLHVGFTFHCCVGKQKVSIRLTLHLLRSTMEFWNRLIKHAGMFPLKRQPLHSHSGRTHKHRM